MVSTITTADADDARAQVDTAVRYWIAQARAVLRLTPRQLPQPQVRFDLRGRAAGQAVLARRRGVADAIRINHDLLAAHADTMLRDTVPHEVAHVAIHRYYKGRRVRPHGPEWRSLMAAFGVPARTCHNLPTTPARRLRRYPYGCGCVDTVWLTSIRHKRALNGTVYTCGRCGQSLHPKA